MSQPPKLKNRALHPYHGCFTGDCPHNNANECVASIKDYVAQIEVENEQLLAAIAIKDEALKIYVRRQPVKQIENCGWNWQEVVNDFGQTWEFDWIGDEQDNPWELAEKALNIKGTE